LVRAFLAILLLDMVFRSGRQPKLAGVHGDRWCKSAAFPTTTDRPINSTLRNGERGRLLDPKFRSA
jgi:hypothetical protein